MHIFLIKLSEISYQLALHVLYYDIRLNCYCLKYNDSTFSIILGDVKGASSGDLTGTFQATSSGSYKCDKEQNIGMGNITLIVSQLQYRAFGTTKNDKYPTESM